MLQRIVYPGGGREVHSGSVGKVLAKETWLPKFRSLVPMKTPDVAACACNPIAGGKGVSGEKKTGRSQRFANKPI